MITQMHPTLETVTPALAEKWLTFNVNNRKMPASNMKFIAREIEAGEFNTTHQGIAFTGTKNNPKRLLDGQTRLSAIARAKRPVQLWVFWNCPEESFQIIDSGKLRSFSDRHGWSKDRTAFMNILYWLSSGYTKPLIKDAEAIMDQFEWCFDTLLAACGTAKKGLSASAVRAGCAIAMHQHKEQAETIASYYAAMIHYQQGEEMPAPPSVRKLYGRLIEVVGGGRDAIQYQVPLTHKAMTPTSWLNDQRLVIGNNFLYLKGLQEYIISVLPKVPA